MPTFDFSDANGTAIDTVDANWTLVSGSSGAASDIETDAGKAVNTNNFSDVKVFYDGSADEAKITHATDYEGTSSNYAAVLLRASGSQEGYKAYFSNIAGSGDTVSNRVTVRRNGSFYANVDLTNSYDLASAETTLRIYDDAGALKIDVDNGTLSETQTIDTDPTPLTGGFGGFSIAINGIDNAIAITEWTDGGGGGGGGGANVVPVVLRNIRLRK